MRELNHCLNCRIPLTKVQNNTHYCPACKDLMIEYNRAVAFLQGNFKYLSEGNKWRLLMVMVSSE